MAVQINTDELKGCKSYFNWIFEQVKPAESSAEDVKVLEALCRLLFDTDYIMASLGVLSKAYPKEALALMKRSMGL